MNIRRAVILMLDSVGIGGAQDAAKFGDRGADTVGHIAKANGGLQIPNLIALGFAKAAQASTGQVLAVGPQLPAALQELSVLRCRML